LTHLSICQFHFYHSSWWIVTTTINIPANFTRFSIRFFADTRFLTANFTRLWLWPWRCRAYRFYGFSIPFRIAEMMMCFYKVINCEVIFSFKQSCSTSNDLFKLNHGVYRTKQNNVSHLWSIYSRTRSEERRVGKEGRREGWTWRVRAGRYMRGEVVE